MRTIIIIGYIAGVVILLFQSCTKEVSFKQKEVEHRLVVNGLIEPDSLITVRISGTVSILEDKAPQIEDSVVNLSIDGNFSETLQYQGEGMYSSRTRAIPGSSYAIEVSAPGYPDVYAMDTLPVAVPVLGGSHRYSGSCQLFR